MSGNNEFYRRKRSALAAVCLLFCAVLTCGCAALGLGDAGEPESFRSSDSDDKQWTLLSEIVHDYRQYDQEYGTAKQNNDIPQYKKTFIWYGKRLVAHRMSVNKMSTDCVSGYKDELLMLNALCDRIYDLRGVLRIAKRPAGQQITAADKKLWEEECLAKQALIEILIGRCAEKYGGYLLWMGKSEEDVLLCYGDLGLENRELLLLDARVYYYYLVESRGAGHLKNLERIRLAVKRKLTGSVSTGSPLLKPSPEDDIWFAANYLMTSADNYICDVKFDTIKKANGPLNRFNNEELIAALQYSRGRIAAAGGADENMKIAAKGLCSAVESLQAADKQWLSKSVDFDGYIKIFNQRTPAFEEMRSLVLCARRDTLLKRNNGDAQLAAKMLEADGIAASTAEHIPALPADFAQQVSSAEAQIKK